VSDLPKFVHLREVGPREGFQFEKAPISTKDKIAFVDALVCDEECEDRCPVEHLRGLQAAARAADCSVRMLIR